MYNYIVSIKQLDLNFYVEFSYDEPEEAREKYKKECDIWSEHVAIINKGMYEITYQRIYEGNVEFTRKVIIQGFEF